MWVRMDFTGDDGIQQGMPWDKLTVAVRDQSGDTFDYTGYTGTFTVWREPAMDDSLHDSPALLELGTATGHLQLGLIDGGPEFGLVNVHLHLPQSLTSGTRPWGRAKYNLDVLSPIGRPEIRLFGAIDFEEGRKHG